MTPEEWADIVWRFGDRALRVSIAGKTPEFADDAGDDRRATIAGESAEMLVTARGGDALERAEFARLFAVGEPQNGLRAFLARSKGMSVAEKT